MSHPDRKGLLSKPKVEVTRSSVDLKEEKKRAFAEYVKKSGMKAAMVRVLVALYEEEEKPDDPLEWIFALLGYGIPTQSILEMYQKEARHLESKIATLQAENIQLKGLLQKKEAVEEAAGLGINWEELLKVSDEEFPDDDIFIRT